MVLNEKELVLQDELFPIEKYHAEKQRCEKAVSFTGSPSKHPYEADKFILILDPVSDHTEFIEFKKEDVVAIEELPSLLTRENESVSMNLVWIKEGALGLKMSPFVVAKTRNKTYLL